MKSDVLALCETPLCREKTWEIDRVAVLKLSAALPQAEGTGRKAKRFNRWYLHFYRSYLRYCTNVLLPRAAELYEIARENGKPWVCPTAKLSFRVTWQDACVLSLYLDAEEMHLPPPLTVRRSDTWDKRTVRLLPCEVFFAPKTPWRKLFFQTARTDLAAQKHAGAPLYPDYRLRCRLHFKKGNFYLTDRAVVFYYQMYILSPHIVSVALPRPQDVAESAFSCNIDKSAKNKPAFSD